LRRTRDATDGIRIRVTGTPSEQFQPFFGDGFFYQSLTAETVVAVYRQEDHGNAVAAFRRQGEAKLCRLFLKKPMGNLRQKPCTVTRLGVAATGTAVRKVNEDFYPVIDNFMGLLALQMGDEP
jgi:hypothetical protein